MKQARNSLSAGLSSAARALLLGSLLLSLGSCKTAAIKEAFMAKDSAGRIRTKNFAAEGSEIHCLITVSSGRDDVILKATLITPEDSTVRGSFEEITPGKGEATIDLQMQRVGGATGGSSSVSNEGPWDPGGYQIDLYLDGEHEDTLTFFVKEPEE